MHKYLMGLLLVLLGGLFVTVGAQEPTSDEDVLIFGMVLVGPRNDAGWSQAHYDAGVFLESRQNARMLLYENYIPGSPDTSLLQIVTDFVEQGAQVVFLTSSDFQQEAERVAPLFPDVKFVHVAGDSVLTGVAPENLTNLMGQMEWAKFVAGCAAALTTESGHIGYVGALINSETRRLVSSAYLGARHCWTTLRNRTAAELTFEVEWVGFWFYLPGTTENPTQLAFSMVTRGADVLISGIDTPEVLSVANEFTRNGQPVYAISYNSADACDTFEGVCLGSAAYNWRLAYADILSEVREGRWVSRWDWRKPDYIYSTISIVHFKIGRAVPSSVERELSSFVYALGRYDESQLVPPSFPLWRGLLLYQDGTVLATDGELVNVLDVWYLPQLISGIQGDSFPSLQQ